MTRADIEAAARRIASRVRHTPVLPLGADGPGAGHDVTLKLELTQHTGSFKARGAFNFALSHPDAGVLVAASGGNHGLAVAYAARALGRRAIIFVPEVSAPVKRARIASYGAEVVVGGDRYADAQLAADAYVRDAGGLLVHPYEAHEVVAGQGTVGRELDTSAPGLDTVLVAVGGGGLIAGIAAWYADRPVRVIGVEPATSCCLAAALGAGEPVSVPVEGIAADSLGAAQVGDLAFAIARDHVERSVTVTDDAIRTAQLSLWEAARIAAEPGGATALAALVSGAYVPAGGERVGVVVCGGNVDLASLAAPDPPAAGGQAARGQPHPEDEIGLRPATAADAERLLALNNAHVPAVNHLGPADIAWFLDHASVTVAETAGGELAGLLVTLEGPGSAYASLNYAWFVERVGRFAYVDRIVVDGRFQGHGLGQRLYRDIAGRARAAGMQMVCAEVNLVPRNEQSLRFHERFGFRLLGERVDDSGKRLAMVGLAL